MRPYVNPIEVSGLHQLMRGRVGLKGPGTPGETTNSTDAVAPEGCWREFVANLGVREGDEGPGRMLRRAE